MAEISTSIPRVSTRKQRSVQRLVWQSGDRYAFGGFEFKAKSYLKQMRQRRSSLCSRNRYSTGEPQLTFDKPFFVEYANDIPGSAFIPLESRSCQEERTVGETAWNMGAMARAEGSLLGVTFPMVCLVGLLGMWRTMTIIVVITANGCWYDLVRCAKGRCSASYKRR